MKVPWHGFEYYPVKRKMQSRLLIKQTETMPRSYQQSATRNNISNY